MVLERFQTPAAQALRDQQGEVALRHLRDVLNDPGRPAELTLAAGPLTLDFTRMLGDRRTLELLASLADELDVPSLVTAMMSGKLVNRTENRAALHTALRAEDTSSVSVGGVDVMPAVRHTSTAVSDFVETVTSGGRRGATGERITMWLPLGSAAPIWGHARSSPQPERTTPAGRVFTSSPTSIPPSSTPPLNHSIRSRRSWS